ncbi:MAG: proline dehydrogenase family protein [Phycisphaerales bacterium]|nr:proline dehydrogenase family protein [Phycisphaerales bacterium]
MAIFTRKSPKQPDAVAPLSAPAPRSAIPVHAGQWRDDRILELGREFLAAARKHRAGMLSGAFWSDKLMNWAMKDQAFKVQLFRFIDCFPMLRNTDDVHEHLVDYLTQPGVTLPPGLSTGLKAGGLAKGLLTKTVSGQIESMARKFIAGVDAADALPRLEKLWKSGIAFSVDLLGEACVSDAEADVYQQRYLDLVRNLPERVAKWPANDRLEKDHLGAVPRCNVSIKISSLSAKCDPIDSDGAIRELMARLGPIIELAAKHNVLINFDMESFHYKDLTLTLFGRCCEKWNFHAGLAMQAYLKSGDADADRIATWAERVGRVVTVRLVKGAYWDYETIHAEEQGWPCPVWNTKRETDACFERMTERFLDATPRASGRGGVKLALGSHNVRSIAAALDGVERRGLPRESLELQMLHGMADDLKAAAADLGMCIREYVPVGEMIPGMAYLVRRLLENTSNESWLMASSTEASDDTKLLASPHGQAGAMPDLADIAAERHELSPARDGIGNGQPFMSEAMRDFAHGNQRERFAKAVAAARIEPVANDRTVDQAKDMLTKADRAFPAWRDFDPKRRADVLIRAAAKMRAARDELAGIMIKESGKTWREADADVCEAIDFCEYYARCAVPLFERHRLGKFIGELDETFYQPRGVAVVISPWNFPLAICCGMTTAALVCGNTVIVKPAEQTPAIAKRMFDILAQSLREVNAPADVLHFCPGLGETVGAALVRDPRTAIIAFTGSKAVGLDIIAAAGLTPDEQPFVKKIVCEMGGKNAVIIDTSADLDEAVVGVRHSAFGFQGQKCSACSRCIVVDPEGPDGPHITTFTHRLVEATRSLVIGDPTRSGSDIGPVIDNDSANKIRHYIAQATKDGATLALAMDAPPADASTGTQPTNYIPPHIFSHVKTDHTIARDEIFGPVLAIMHANTFDDALALANASPYKLTGGVFTRKPSHLEQARREFRVGNLYLNRGCTGALVARQPFGGFGMSGVGSKAGGADYLLQFVEPRAVCENTMRRGFAPEL